MEEEMKTVENGVKDLVAEMWRDRTGVSEAKKDYIAELLISKMLLGVVDLNAVFTSRMKELVQGVIDHYFSVERWGVGANDIKSSLQLLAHAERVAGLINDHVIYNSRERARLS